MAEPFGIVSGAIGIASAFTACVDCFEYIQLGRHFGRDFQTRLLVLNCTKLRLTRWGQAVDIYNDPKLGNPTATQAEINNAKDILLQILVLFAETEKISKKYKLSAKASDDLSVYSSNDMDPAFMTLNNTMKELANKRKKETSLLKLTSWALYHGSEFERLIENVITLIDNLENMFPAPARQLDLVKQEVKEVQSKQDLEVLKNATEDVDSLLHSTTNEALTGHSYVKVEVRGGRAQNGDAFGNNWNRGAIGKSHLYNGVVVEGDAKVLNGNKYGGKDFWED